MKAAAKKINPEEYILSVLSPEERLKTVLKIASEAFKGAKLSVEDIENAIKRVRKNIYKK
ncbi:MAG: hypothetical protein M1381_03915 [Deltaproteobacteria bacterium]|nr:hypothetical protein [Deltaproteobacteria bacterium]MCL5792729.1 hypothetical protein [Deltaproteobacteria bacterium]